MFTIWYDEYSSSVKLKNVVFIINSCSINIKPHSFNAQNDYVEINLKMIKYHHTIDYFSSLWMGINDTSDSYQIMFANVCVYDDVIDWDQIIDELV